MIANLQQLLIKLRTWRKNWPAAKFIYFYARGWQGEQIAAERFWRVLNDGFPYKDNRFN